MDAIGKDAVMFLLGLFDLTMRTSKHSHNDTLKVSRTKNSSTNLCSPYPVQPKASFFGICQKPGNLATRTGCVLLTGFRGCLHVSNLLFCGFGKQLFLRIT